MTKSTITREESVQAVFDLKVGYRLGFADLEILKRVARIALAAMDSEPVAWLLSGGGAKNVVCFDSGNAYADPLREVTPLYRHAQPAPVVPGGYVMVAASLLSELRDWAHPKIEDYCEMWAGRRDDEFPALRKVIADTDALLAAAPQSPGSEPATAPGKWIPVSERMPDVGVKVLCFPVKDEPIHATFNGQLWLQDVSWSGSDDPIDNVIPVSVTHWMPLPAAPQEVK
ncbi:TPA: DUF551 domain-containing protein [Klebsiella variicola]